MTYFQKKNMSLVDGKSIPSTKSELDLFTVPPTQVVVKRGFWEEIQPMNPVSNDGPYEFRIPPDPNFIQLNKNYVYIQMAIRKPTVAAGVTIPDYATINLIGKTLFSQVKCSLGNRLVFDSSDKYAYRAFLETELNYGSDAKNSHLQSALYFKESGLKIDTKDSGSFKTRAEFFKDEAIVEVAAPLHIDLFLQDRYLLNYMDVKIELLRNSDSFVLQCLEDINLKLDILKMKLFLRKVEVLDSVNMAIESVLKTSTVKYPIRRVVLTNIHLSNPARETPHQALFTGQLPRRLVFGCVEGDAYRGNIKKSPFIFKNFNIKDVKVNCGGQTFPQQPLNVDFKNNIYIQAYNQLFEALDQSRENKGNIISRADFKNTHCIFAFDLTPDEDDSGHWDLVREGTTSIDIKFSDALPDSGIEIVVYAEFDNLLMIDKDRNVFFDYSA
jgi:hypothetical protein